MRALVDPEAEGGQFFGPATVTRGEPRRAKAAALTRDPAVAERLWQTCEEATGVRWPFAKAARAAR